MYFVSNMHLCKPLLSLIIIVLKARIELGHVS